MVLLAFFALAFAVLHLFGYYRMVTLAASGRLPAPRMTIVGYAFTPLVLVLVLFAIIPF